MGRKSKYTLVHLKKLAKKAFGVGGTWSDMNEFERVLSHIDPSNVYLDNGDYVFKYKGRYYRIYTRNGSIRQISKRRAQELIGKKEYIGWRLRLM